jgi:cytochrome P450
MRAPPYSTRPDELFTREAIEDPHPLFARLRDACPISRVGDTGVHLVSTWDLIDEVLGREGDFSAHLTGVLMRGESGEPAVFDLPGSAATQVIATADDPEHAVHRALVQPGLAASRIGRLETSLRAWARAATAPWLAAGGGDFAPLSETVPARAIGRVLGLPDGDVGRHRTWAMMGGDILAGDVTQPGLVALAEETVKMITYLQQHIDAARGESQAGAVPEPDDAPMLHALARGVDEGKIDMEHAVGIAVVMFGAGGESTAALIGSAVRRLAADPEIADELRRSTHLVPRFIEEVARLEPPFKFHYRVVRRDCALGDVDLVPGDRLMLLWTSANRDASQLDDPDALRLDRRHPKRHMSFGRGAHFCIGAPLARREARVVCEEILAGSTDLSLSRDAPPIHARSIFVRRLERLPVTARLDSSSHGRGR